MSHPTTSAQDFDRLLDVASRALDDLHGTSHGPRFWGILTYRYLNKCMQADEYGVSSGPVPASAAEDDDVLGTRTSDAPAAGREVRRRVSTGGAFERVRRLRHWRATSREQALMNALREAPLGPSRSVLGEFHYYHVIGQRVEPPAAYLNAASLTRNVTSDSSRRPELRAMAERVEWPLARRALDWMPRYYVEEFQSRTTSVRVESPQHKTIHAAFLPSVDTRFYTARHVQEGSALALYQHAGYYGEVPWTLHHAEATLADRFLTWGWKLHPHDVPFLALRLMKPAAETIRFRPRARDWLYVNVRQPFSWRLDETLDTQDRLFASLRTGRAGRIVVRARVNKGGSVARQVGPRARQTVAVDDGRRAWRDALQSAALVILDHFPTTSFLECIVAGIPVVAIVPEGTVFTPVAEPFYTRFLEAGLLHRSPEAAGEFLNGVSVNAWWQDVLAADWLVDYRRTFCRMTDMPSETSDS